MKGSMKKTIGKRAYEKPRLRVVNIAPGTQTLGVGCKINNIEGDPNIMQAIGCGITNSCVSEGS